MNVSPSKASSSYSGNSRFGSRYVLVPTQPTKHTTSDIDFAVELDGLQPGDDGYNAVFFELYESISEVLESDSIDLLDVHSLSGSLARTVLTDGRLVDGELDRVESLRKELSDSDHEERSPRERLDTAIERMNRHLT